MTVEVNKPLGLSEPSFFVVEFNHTPQGKNINWRNVDINYPDIDKAFKEQESYVTLFERQVMVIGQILACLHPDAKDFSVLKKGAYDLVLEVEDFLLNKIEHSKFSPDVDEGYEELEIVFGRMKLQNLKVKGISSVGILMCIQLNGRYVTGRTDIFGISRNTRSPQGPQAHPNGEDMQIASSEQQLTVDDFDVGGNIGIIGQSDIPVTGSENPLLSPEILPQLYGMKQDDAAKFLGVSRSTFKRICRKHGISKWPFCRGKTGSNELAKLNCGNELPPEHRVSSIAFNIKATYGIDIIQFPLSSSSRKAELEENISKRLKLNLGNFKIQYMDTDGDKILITCDEDLQYCMIASERLGHKTIKMFVEDIANT